MEDLTEVITGAEFHPTSNYLFIYSSSKGTIRLCDMRKKALCDDHVCSKYNRYTIELSKRKSYLHRIITVW